MHWYERFGYEKNPFELNPFKSEFMLVNHVSLIDDISYLTHAGSMFVIEGEQGTGKTMFLKKIIDEFKGAGKVVYLDGKKIKPDVDIEQVLNKQGKSLLGLFSSKPKGMILLFDSVEALSSKNCEKIKYYFDQNYIKTVIFTTTDYSQLQINPSIRDRIMNQIIKIPPMNKFSALRIVRERFGDHFFLSDEVILKIFSISENNIKMTLKNCNDICQFVVKEGRGEVLPKYLPIIVKRKYKRQTILPKSETSAAWNKSSLSVAQKQEG